MRQYDLVLEAAAAENGYFFWKGDHHHTPVGHDVHNRIFETDRFDLLSRAEREESNRVQLSVGSRIFTHSDQRTLAGVNIFFGAVSRWIGYNSEYFDGALV